MLLAGFFPTIFSIQRISHFGHHRRNRTDEELYDYVPARTSRGWLKTYWIYCLLTGFYWAIIPVAILVYIAVAVGVSLAAVPERSCALVGLPAIRAGHRARTDPARLAARASVSLALQVTLVIALDLAAAAGLLCYWAFGLNWSSVQYTRPRRQPARRDRRRLEPALLAGLLRRSSSTTISTSPIIASPNMPWMHLPKLVRPNDSRPVVLVHLLRLWLGARPAPAGPGPQPLNELQP